MRKFSQKFHTLFNDVILKGEALGTVTHYFIKKEYQARGAPHYHLLLWIQDAPVIGKDRPDDVLKFIQDKITCRIPQEESNPELHRLVTKYQLHKCSAYCKVRKKFNGIYVTRCKFAFPREVRDTATLNPVDECLKSRNKKIYLLPRADHEVRVNDYNPLLLLLWKANMDIQFIAEASLALAHYVSGYVTKAERSNMQEVWEEVGSNKSVYSRLWSFGVRSLRSRECGLYEATDLLLGDHLCEKSVCIKWIDAAWPHKRKRRLRNYKDLVELQENDPDSADIFEDNLIDTFYPQRPRQLENVCLYDFVSEYERCGQDDSGKYEYRKLSKPRLPNHKLFDPNKENQREDYFYSLLLLFVPFRSEDQLLEEGETAEQAFNRLLVDNTDLNVHHTKLDTMLVAQTKLQEINKERLAEQPASAVVDDEDDGPTIAGIEAQAAMKDVQDLQANSTEKISLDKRISMLNKDQARIFQCVADHLRHQQRHESGVCTCSHLKSLQMFVSGVGGTGKSFLIEAIRAQVAAIWKDKGNGLTCAVAAPTGLAAYNVGGITVHRLFQLPIEHEGRTAQYWQLPKASQKVMRNTLRDVKLIVIDEVSMLSSLNLAYMHLRLAEVFGGDEWFGSRNVLFIGDFLQLPPVNGQSVFEKLNSTAILSRLGCMTSANIWQETVQYDELTINERQKNDKEYCTMLDEVRRGSPSTNTIQKLEERLLQVSAVEKFEELQQAGKSPVCLFPTRKACESFNSEMLDRLDASVVEVPCIDEVDETAGVSKWSKKAADQLSRLNKDCNMTAGLEAVLRLAVGARVMLRRNIDTERGLVNGALGTVISVSAQCVKVKFDQSGESYEIEKVRSKFQVMKKFYVYRKQFPLILAYAVTVHKCQGLSLDCAIVDLSDAVFCAGMAYVALSRVRTLDGLHLIAFDPKSIMVSVKCLSEINRLRQLYRKDLPPYDIPAQKRAIKRKISVTCTIDEPKAKAGRKGRKLVVPSVTKDSKPARTVPRKRARSSTAEGEKSSKKSCIITYSSNDGRAGQQMEWPMFRYNPFDVERQREACEQLGLEFRRPNRFARGGENVVLTRPNLRTVKNIPGDGNCLFRALAYIITGTQLQHFELRLSILNHMQTIAHFLLEHHIMHHNSIDDYIADNHMDLPGFWGTDIEMLALAHLLQTNIYSYDTSLQTWIIFHPGAVDGSPRDVTQKSMYIVHYPNHFAVVCAVL